MLLATAVVGDVRAQYAPRPQTCAGDTLALAPNRTVDTIAPGIVYQCVVDPRGPWVVHVAAIELKRYRVNAERAKGAFLGRERTSTIAERVRATGARPWVAINADFFDLRTGEVENNHVSFGEWVKGALASDSPHDEFDNPHTQFAVDSVGRPYLGRFELVANATLGGVSEPLVGINYRPAQREGLVLYTPWYGARTFGDTTGPRLAAATGPQSAADARADSARRLALASASQSVELLVRRIGRRGDSVLYRIERAKGRLRRGGGHPIPLSGAVLSATAASRAFVERAARAGGVIRVVAQLSSPRVTPRAVVGGWPRLLTNGENVGARSDSLEGTFPRFSASRHPRSALGITRDSTTLLMVVVDGRRSWSVGMSLAEMADFMRELGAYQAMNLDGGGSTALWIRDHVVNVPSDPGGERAVGNALVVSEAPPPQRSSGRRRP